MNNQQMYKLMAVGGNVQILLPPDEQLDCVKFPVYVSKRDGSMYPLTQLKNIEFNRSEDTYKLNWENATASISKSVFNAQIKPYIEIVNK